MRQPCLILLPFYHRRKQIICQVNARFSLRQKPKPIYIAMQSSEMKASHFRRGHNRKTPDLHQDSTHAGHYTKCNEVISKVLQNITIFAVNTIKRSWE
jgi:hypothetical protein